MHKSLSSNPSLPLYLTISSIYLTLQSVLLLTSPSLISTLLSPSSLSSATPVTSLETYLSRALGFALLALAFYGTSSLLTATLISSPPPPPVTAPTPATTAASAVSAGTTQDPDPDPSSLTTIGNETGVLTTTLSYHTISAIHGYINSSSSNMGGSGAFMFHALMSGGLSVYGLWVVMFGAQVRVGSGDGRDKRVSGILFGKGKKI